MTGTKRTESNVLRYSVVEIHQGTVRRFYLRWRCTQGLPERCDKNECQYFDAPLVWNGKPFKVILDHINGNRDDNRTDNLRFLCPNCESQLPTRGGKNKGKIDNKSDQGYEIKHPNGSRDAMVFPKGGSLKCSAGQPTVRTSQDDESA